MSARTVDWTAPRTTSDGAPPEGLRERKKRLMRQQLSDTATEMFVERGFDAVRVSEVAEACGVSEKTVFNYFPTKEALVLDIGEATEDALRSGFAEPGISPVQAMLKILGDQLDAVLSWLDQQEDPGAAIVKHRRFDALIQSTPSLRAYQRDMADGLVSVAAGILAERAGMSLGDPEPQIAATALLGLWPIQFRALVKHLDVSRTRAEVEEAVLADVHRAARLLENGLRSFAGATRTG